MTTEPQTQSQEQWFYLKGDETIGPVSKDELRSLLFAQTISGSTFVFRPGMTDWQKASMILELQPEGVHQAPPLNRSENNTKPEFPSTLPSMWWPSSLLGSAVAAAALSHGTVLVVTSIGVIMALYRLNKTTPDAMAIFGVVQNALLLVIAYVVFVGLRNMLVVAPQKRLLRKKGLSIPPRQSWFDHLLANSRTFIVTGLVVSGVMAAELASSYFARQALLANIDANANAVDGMRGQAEQLSRSPTVKVDGLADELSERQLSELERTIKQDYDRALRNGVPSDMAAESYRKGMAEVRSLRSQLAEKKAQNAAAATEFLEKGASLYVNSAMSAVQARSLKISMFWSGGMALLGLGFAWFVWKQKRADAELANS